MHEHPAKSDESCAVVVTFHPDPGFSERLGRLLGQVGHAVVVDNTPRMDRSRVPEEIAKRPRVTLLHNDENLGVAAALNRGMAESRARGFAWVVAFDQDSSAEPGLVDHLVRVWRDAVSAGLGPIAVVGTNHVNPDTGERYVEFPMGEPPAFIERATVVTSGSLFSVAAYEVIGPFRDDLFIDSVDHEYCLRARRKGYRVLFATAPLLVHEMGRRRNVRLPLGREIQTLNYPPFRWYFIVKNLLTLAGEYGRTEPAWTAARLAGLAKRLVITLSMEEERVAKARCMGLGALDFATGHRTRTPADLAANARAPGAADRSR